MKDWCHTFAEDLWLKPDNIGAEEATFIKKAGLVVETAYGSKSGEPYGRSSKRLIVVGRK